MARQGPWTTVVMQQWRTQAAHPTRCPRLRAAQPSPREALALPVEARPRALAAPAPPRMGPPAVRRPTRQAVMSRPPARRPDPRLLDNPRTPVAPLRQRREMT